MNQLLFFLAYANWWIAGASAALAASTYVRFSQHVNIWVILFIFLSSLLLYTFQRVLKFLYIKQHAPHYDWCKRHYRFLLFQCVLALLGLVPLIPRLPVLLIYTLLTGGVFSILYFFVSPFNLKATGLRQLPFLKSILIACVWAMVTVLVPVMDLTHDYPSSEQVVWVFMEQFLFIYVLMIPFDIRDLRIDPASMKTLPQVAGKKGALITGTVLITVYVLTQVLASVPTPLTDASLLFSAVLIWFSQKDRTELFYPYVIDGMIYVYALSVWADSLLLQHV